MCNVLFFYQDVIEIFVLVVLVLYNFLRESDVYCFIGFFDIESVMGEVLIGWWC